MKWLWFLPFSIGADKSLPSSYWKLFDFPSLLDMIINFVFSGEGDGFGMIYSINISESDVSIAFYMFGFNGSICPIHIKLFYMAVFFRVIKYQFFCVFRGKSCLILTVTQEVPRCQIPSPFSDKINFWIVPLSTSYAGSGLLISKVFK